MTDQAARLSVWCNSLDSRQAASCEQLGHFVLLPETWSFTSLARFTLPLASCHGVGTVLDEQLEGGYLHDGKCVYKPTCSAFMITVLSSDCTIWRSFLSAYMYMVTLYMFRVIVHLLIWHNDPYYLLWPWNPQKHWRRWWEWISQNAFWWLGPSGLHGGETGVGNGKKSKNVLFRFIPTASQEAIPESDEKKAA